MVTFRWQECACWQEEGQMPSKKTRFVNLDALIERADFEAEADTSQSTELPGISIRDLERERSFFLRSLRKPDFQRETASWEPEQVRDFIGTFIEGDFYPAIILWRSKIGTFMIDGAHRLSALIAWVEDDYGDGPTSMKFFGPGNVSEEQLKYAVETRRIVERLYGKYKDYFAVLHSADIQTRSVDSILEKRAIGFGQRGIPIQWVPGDASKAEDSFFKINRSATLIDKIELEILRARRKPTGLAARAMLRAGKGYKYWHRFHESKRQQIEEEAKTIYERLWTPILEVPLTNPDLPVAGANYSTYTLPLLYQFISLANQDSTSIKKRYKRRRKRPESTLAGQPVDDERADEDKDGSATIVHLRNVSKIADRISSRSFSGSLGLHPGIYFYSSEGRFQPTSFLAIVQLIKQLELEGSFRHFTDVRGAFEDFFLKYKHFSNQVTGKWGSGIKAYEPFYKLLRFILARLADRCDEATILSALQKHEAFKFLAPVDSDSVDTIGRDFNKTTRSRVFLEEIILKPARRCTFCNGYIDPKSLTMDHKTPKARGGVGSADNAQVMHPYCNTLKGSALQS
jgi:hypothetical protein